MSVVIATAGHVDHGKSTLVHALTGMQPDRLEAERRRGLTIDLGFAWTRIAGQPIAFVDVPGHERFITTMLAGIGAVPLALLVVAADDPWMPQTAEHLAALDALGVSRGVVAVTRSDLADPAPSMARARVELDGTSLQGAPILAVSAVTGAGIEALRSALASLAATAPAPDPRSDVRLWVDRRFTIQGAGTVVTGTLPQGTVRAGDELTSPHGSVRIRSIETQGDERTAITGPARVALNLTGASHLLGRGDPLWVSGHWFEGDVLDVRLTSGQERPPRTPMLHIGAWSGQVRLRQIDDVHVQLLLDTPLPLRQGDRMILRDPGDRQLWGALLLDPDARPIRGAGARAERSAGLWARGEVPDYDAELSARGIATAGALRRLGLHGVDARAWHLSPAWQEKVMTEIGSLVREHDAAHPANPGMAPVEILRALHLPAGLPTEVLGKLLPTGLRLEGGKVTSRAVELPAHVEDSLGVLAEDFATDPFGAPTLERLRELGLTEKDLAAAARLARVFVPAPGIVLPPTAPRRAIELVSALPQPFTTSEARQALDTSRRVVIPLLDFLDRARVTRRLPDDRRELL